MTKKILSKIGNILFYLFAGFMVIIIVLSIYAKKTNKPILNYSLLWVQSGSMEPTIETNSYILVKKVKDVHDLHPDQIITFICEDKTSDIYGEYNTHRIVAISEDYKTFLTKGDNNNANDNPISSEDIRYVYVGDMNIITFITRAYQTRWGLICSFALIFGIVIIYLNYYLKKMRKESEEERMKELVAKEVEKLRNQNKQN